VSIAAALFIILTVLAVRWALSPPDDPADF